jgi:threonine/homoserine/homoserine lactone efflux protein
MLVAALQAAFAIVVTLGPIAALIYLVVRDWRVERDRERERERDRQANKRVRNYLTRSYR